MLPSQPNDNNENVVSSLNHSLQIDGMSSQTNIESQNVPSAINHTLSNENAKHKCKTGVNTCPAVNDFTPPAVSTLVSNTFNEAKTDLISSVTSTTNSICTTGTSHNN